MQPKKGILSLLIGHIVCCALTAGLVCGYYRTLLPLVSCGIVLLFNKRSNYILSACELLSAVRRRFRRRRSLRSQCQPERAKFVVCLHG